MTTNYLGAPPVMSAKADFVKVVGGCPAHKQEREARLITELDACKKCHTGCVE